jgi:putative transposase
MRKQNSTELKTEFIYLAVVLDAFSRNVVGWSLDRSLQARLPTSALEMAIMIRQPPPGLVHHSDQGVQYRCGGYIQVLRDHRIVAGISRPGQMRGRAGHTRYGAS